MQVTISWNLMTIRSVVNTMEFICGFWWAYFWTLMDFVSRQSDCHICRCGSSTCMAAYGSWGRQSQHANCWLEVGICSFSSHNCAILPELPVQLSSQSTYLMPSRLLCNDEQLEHVKLSPNLAFGPFCYVTLHNIRYGIVIFGQRDWAVCLTR